MTRLFAGISKSTIFGAALLLAISSVAARAQSSAPIVFLIVMENHNWAGSGGIASSIEAPYINKTLVPMAAVAGS